ncbi:alpha/beta fold hydrolase [Streptomyces sp. SID3343]|uniref:alpha/beta fold hydrolase n=1 Tax=Streptomyces sp. SID3343 TaxID=2690260 RepID=UPI0031F9E34E
MTTFAPDDPGDGPDSGPPVLLVHGFCSDARRAWVDTGIVRALTDAGRTVFAPDLRGHGESPAPLGAAEAHAGAAAADLLAVLDAAGVDLFDVVAYSLGARVTWELVGLASARVDRVVLGGMSPFEPFAAVDVPALRSAVAGEAAPEDPLTAMIAGLIRAEGSRADGLVTCVEGLRETPFAPESWAGAVQPLFVVGADDAMTHGNEALLALAGHARPVTVAGDHLGALAGPGFRDAAVGFLTR